MRLFHLLSQIDIKKDELDIPKAGLPLDTSDSTISTVLEFVFGLLGGVALLIIVIAGIKFIFSRGDPQKTSEARDTIIYAAIGLVISALAFSIVRFVIGEI